MLVIFYFEDSFRGNLKDMCEKTGRCGGLGARSYRGVSIEDQTRGISVDKEENGRRD